jgi:asparagine synthase (glutamine-hydrolysing)
MCGIAGVFSNTTRLTDPETYLRRMLARIRHRGPDESGIFISDRVALGSVRLSIIDIQTGQQPLATADGKYWIVYNGEIFNYIELRADLIRKGHAFKTESDTEVLLHAYIEYDTDCLNRLNGQFAFAIWDSEKKELFLARDRVGIRPLFYTRVNNCFVFGSEIKALLEYPDVKAGIDPVSLSQVFTFWSTVTPGTIFRDIYELSPGHWMRITDKETVIKMYWSQKFPSNQGSYFSGSLDDATDELRKLLTDAVKVRLRADVPVAAYLSGGLDSSATTALIKSVAPDSLQTFSIGFEDGEFDETPYQQEVSKYLNTRHKSFTCTREDIGSYFPRMIWHTETPVLRTAPVPMYCLSKNVRENNIKVVITGEGADEMLAGYDIFKEAIIREFWSRQPDSKYRPLLLNKLYPYLAQFQGKNKSMLKFFYKYQLTETASPFYSHILRWHNTSSVQNYFSAGIKNALTGTEHETGIRNWLPADFGKFDTLNKAQWLETFLFMSGYLLSSQGDRPAMANSVEGRYPFLDYRVMEFCASLPPSFKMHGLNEKYILKKMMDKQLPESVLKRPKQAYRAPMASSFFSKSASPYVNELLSESNIDRTGLFDKILVQRLLTRTRSGLMPTEMENMALSGIISTQLLYHQFVSGDDYKPGFTPLDQCKILYDKKAV